MTISVKKYEEALETADRTKHSSSDLLRLAGTLLLIKLAEAVEEGMRNFKEKGTR